LLDQSGQFNQLDRSHRRGQSQPAPAVTPVSSISARQDPDDPQELRSAMQDLQWLLIPFLLELVALAYFVVPRTKSEARDRETETPDRLRAQNGR
jgi:hypothetical protein